MEGENLPMNDQLFESLKWWENRKKYENSPYVWVIENGPHAGNLTRIETRS